MSSPIAFWSTKWTLDIATRLIKADVRLHNVEAIRDDMAIVYVVNHFTRLETMLLPYELHKHTGKEIWSLAASELFRGRIGSYLRSMGCVSTRDPDRDRTIVHALLTGEHPWIIFPEGGMIKDKKVVDHRREFSVYSDGTRRPPHRGAAVLALRAEFYRQKLACLAERPDTPGLPELLERFNLESLDDVLNKRTVIVPVNVTYYPIRAGDNVFLRMARGMAKDLSPRALEELSVEGTLLSEDTDIDITLGEPIDVRSYLDAPEYAPLMACGERDMALLEQDPKSLFSDAARQIALRYMRSIYDNTTINYDHIFATLIRHQTSKAFTERAYRNRIYLCIQRLLDMDKYRLHGTLVKTYRDILFEEPSPKFHDFMALCIEEGIIRKEGNLYYKNFSLRQGLSDFHSVRQKELSYVIANEIEPMEEVNALVREVARTPRRRLSKTIRSLFLEEDERIFRDDYEAFYAEDESKPMEVGAPFLLRPRLRLKGGVVLVHGYLAAPLEIRALAEFLYRKGYAVYGVRLKGHGTAPADLAQTPWEAWYESVNRGYAVIKSLTDHIVVGGFSTGGGLALLAAGRKGAKIRGVFSINAPLQLRNFAARFAPSIVSMNNLFTKVRRRRGGLEYVDNRPENIHINYTRNPVTGVRELGAAMAAMEAALPDICVPTLILQGSRDPVVNPVSGQLIFDKVGSASKELAILERDRHGIVNGEGSQDVFEHVHRFLEWAAERPPEVLLSVNPSTTGVA
jgi:esterase/lipase/1-acyl-sn-glycerol-3-phosphate acyltransferase